MAQENMNAFLNLVVSVIFLSGRSSNCIIEVLCVQLYDLLRIINCFQVLEEEFTAQLEEQERQAANARLPSLPSNTMPQHSSTLHSSRTSLASSHYD